MFAFFLELSQCFFGPAFRHICFLHSVWFIFFASRLTIVVVQCWNVKKWDFENENLSCKKMNEGIAGIKQKKMWVFSSNWNPNHIISKQYYRKSVFDVWWLFAQNVYEAIFIRSKVVNIYDPKRTAHRENGLHRTGYCQENGIWRKKRPEWALVSFLPYAMCPSVCFRVFFSFSIDWTAIAITQVQWTNPSGSSIYFI